MITLYITKVSYDGKIETEVADIIKETERRITISRGGNIKGYIDKAQIGGSNNSSHTKEFYTRTPEEGVALITSYLWNEVDNHQRRIEHLMNIINSSKGGEKG